MPPMLEYARPDPPLQRWGPYFFIPSIRSIVLLILIVPCGWWVKMHHVPWIHVGEVDEWIARDAKPQGLPAFTSNNQFIHLNADRECELIDPATGRVLSRHKTPLPQDSQVFPLRGGRELLIFSPKEPNCIVLDAQSGNQLRKLSAQLPEFTIESVNDDATRVVLYNKWHQRLGIHDLTADSFPSRVDKLDSGYMRCVDNGKYIVTGNYWMHALEVQTLQGFELPAKAEHDDWLNKVTGSYQIVVRAQTAWRTSPTPYGISQGLKDPVYKVKREVDVFELPTGQPLGAFEHTFPGWMGRRPAMEACDRTRVAVSSQKMYAIWDLREMRQIGPLQVKSQFFGFLGSGQHYAAVDDRYGKLCIFGQPGRQPLAILDGLIGNPMLSPDGKSIACNAQIFTTFYHRGRPECRESRLGILGMPHVWLLGLLGTGFVISMSVDAQRKRRDNKRKIPTPLLWMMVLIGLAGSLHLLLSRLNSQPVLHPAPLVLLAGIFLFTHSRFWGVVTLLILSGALYWCYLTSRMLWPFVASNPLMVLLDRIHDLPQYLPLATVVGIGTLMLISAAIIAMRLVLAQRAD